MYKEQKMSSGQQFSPSDGANGSSEGTPLIARASVMPHLYPLSMIPWFFIFLKNTTSFDSNSSLHSYILTFILRSCKIRIDNIGCGKPQTGLASTKRCFVVYGNDSHDRLLFWLAVVQSLCSVRYYNDYRRYYSPFNMYVEWTLTQHTVK